jgi:hypothetical protein
MNLKPSAGRCAVCNLDVFLADPPRTPDGQPMHAGCERVRAWPAGTRFHKRPTELDKVTGSWWG